MPEGLRIAADELKQRMEAGEQFTIVDVRNPHAWAEAKDKAAGAMRVALDDVEHALRRSPRSQPIVTYCT
jgi:rhodanese-related sulfurtransferase